MVDVFLRELNLLSEQKPGDYTRSVENIGIDLRGSGNPHGNITEAAQDSIERCCCAGGAAATDHLEKVIGHHLSFRPAGGREPVVKPPQPLRTVVPFTVYVDHHLAGSVETLRHLGHRPPPAPEREQVPIGGFGGSTHRVDPGDERPTWWSFGTPLPECGRDCIAELALPDATARLAETCGGVVAIEVPVDAFPQPLYKPSGLDGFGPGSKFKPDLSDTPHGWTAPDGPGRTGCPELVSKSFRYAGIEDKAPWLTVTCLPM